MLKTDRRVRYTKQIIKTSLLELLENESFENITVKALCQTADITRATFYSHYETLSALMEEIEYEEAKQLFDLLDDLLTDESQLYQSTAIILQYLKEHPTLRNVILCRNSVGKGMTRLIRERMDKSLQRITASEKINMEQGYWLMSFIAYGMREILLQWFESDMNNEDEFIQVLSLFIQKGLSAFT